MGMLIDVFSVVANQWVSILFLLAIIFSGVSIIISLLRNATGNSLTDIEYFSLGISGWLIFVLFWAVITRLSLRVFDSKITFIGVTGFLFIFSLFKVRVWKTTKISLATLLLITILLFSITVNMAFISRVTFPAYFDSAEHYRIIKFILETPAGLFGKWPTPSYYHIGYHLMMAALLKLSGTGIVDGMLISGQVALSILAVSVFFIVKQETDSNTAAFFTTLLAGFGWYMPAHAINWGKYPSLFGLIGIIFVFNLIHLISQKKSTPFEARKLIPILFAGVAAAAIIHTRSLIVCSLFAAAILTAVKWEALDKRVQRFMLGTFFIAMLVCGIYLRNDATLISLISPYMENDLPAVGLLSFLGIFALWKFPRLTFALLLFTSTIFFSLYIPVNGLLGYSGLFLLDRPYVQILLHIPFSLIVGLGFAGLLEVCGKRVIVSVPARGLVQLGMFGLLAINAIFYQKYYPSDCCQLAGRDDAAAFSWIQNELLSNSTILIASQNLFLSQDTSFLSTTGIDAGIWVTPITGKQTALFSSNTDFSQVESHSQICDLDIDFIYAGNKRESFNESGLKAKPEWYQSIFVLPEVKIYKLLGCS